MTSRSTLLIVERAHRGAIETQFTDVLFSIRELNRQSGGLDLALRGLAVSYAVGTDAEPSLRIGDRVLDELPAPRRSIRALIDDGVTVWVEEPDVRALGERARDRLVLGVRCIAPPESTSLWAQYEHVWFM